MKWLTALVATAALAGAASVAHAATYTVDVNFPVMNIGPGFAYGGTSFSTVTLNPGQSLDINASFDQPVMLETSELPFTRITLDLTPINGSFTGHDLDIVQDYIFQFIKNGATGFQVTESDDLSDNPGLIFDVSGVSFYSSVPEPSTWVMMIFGIGSIGLFFRRCKFWNKIGDNIGFGVS